MACAARETTFDKAIIAYFSTSTSFSRRCVFELGGGVFRRFFQLSKLYNGKLASLSSSCRPDYS